MTAQKKRQVSGDYLRKGEGEFVWPLNTHNNRDGISGRIKYQYQRRWK